MNHASLDWSNQKGREGNKSRPAACSCRRRSISAVVVAIPSHALHGGLSRGVFHGGSSPLVKKFLLVIFVLLATIPPIVVTSPEGVREVAVSIHKINQVSSDGQDLLLAFPN